MGPFTHDTELCLREFSKSLTNRAYTWYVNWKPISVHDWSIWRLFYTLVLRKQNYLRPSGWTRQYPEEGLNYMSNDFIGELRIAVPVDEEVLVNVCLHDMLKEYRIFLENLSFPTFSSLMEASRRTNVSKRRTSRPNTTSYPNSMMRPPSRKWPIVAAHENLMWPSFKQEHKTFQSSGATSIWHEESHSSVGVVG